ncbi:MAG TPA: permease-like cell division protein FtsX [Gaiellaceae bacterium]|nr:permease-like cell division protein FtsX [Gaiellaceae bacterium]
MTGRVRLLFSEAWSSITANVSTTFAAVITVLISMFLLGLLIALGSWLLSYSNHVKKGVLVQVYFSSTATQQQEVEVGQKLHHDPRVAKVTFVSKAQAFKQMAKEYPDLYKNVPSNPLPDAWDVKLRHAEDAPTLGREIQRAINSDSAAYPGVNDVKWGAETTKRVLTVAKWISIVFLVAIVLLVTASTLLIANTIRLSIFARRREIEVMKLVGATNWFVRGPFMLEGLLQGLVGALSAVILLVLGKTVALPAILPHLHGGSDVHPLPFAVNAVLLLVGGLILGAAGSGLTLRRFLQV